jgi:hypothetical protein
MSSFILYALATVGLLTVVSFGVLSLMVANDRRRRSPKHLARATDHAPTPTVVAND